MICHNQRQNAPRSHSKEFLSEDETPSFAASSGAAQAYDTAMYNADMMKFRKMVMTIQEFNNGEHGNTPSE